MQGQQTVAASGISTNSTVNPSATGTSVTTPTSNDKPITTTTTTNRSNNSPPPSIALGASSITTINVNGPSESDAITTLDEQTTTGGDSINKDHS